MKHGLVKPQCTLAMSDEAKVQALLESHPSDNVRKGPKYLTQRARLGPQTPYKNRPHTAISLDAHSEPSSSPTLQGHAAHPLMVRVGKDRSHTTPPSSISRRLDDMLSTPFSPRIIKYEPPRGFIVPKFSTYDGSAQMVPGGQRPRVRALSLPKFEPWGRHPQGPNKQMAS